jgi:hypothetical protein
MRVPSFLFLLSLAGVAVAFALPGMSDLILIAGPSCLASLWLLFRAARARPEVAPERTVRRPARARKDPAWIVIDGSNVMHWGGDSPCIEPVREVVTHLEGLGFTPGVIFDANAGHLLRGRYCHDHVMGKMVGLPPERVMVVDKGTPADPTILQEARDLNARVVTNDRYRDWAERFPDIRRPGFLVRGGFRKGRIWLDLDKPVETAPPNLEQAHPA